MMYLLIMWSFSSFVELIRPLTIDFIIRGRDSKILGPFWGLRSACARWCCPAPADPSGPAPGVPPAHAAGAPADGGSAAHHTSFAYGGGTAFPNFMPSRRPHDAKSRAPAPGADPGRMPRAAPYPAVPSAGAGAPGLASRGKPRPRGPPWEAVEGEACAAGPAGPGCGTAHRSAVKVRGWDAGDTTRGYRDQVVEPEPPPW